MKRTKIVATIGPATAETKVMETLLKNGANVFRFNFKHNTKHWHKEVIKRARQTADGLSHNLAIMADLPIPTPDEILKEVDFAALSYIKNEKQVVNFRKELSKQKIGCKIISKIENGSALKKLAAIAEASDGVMVARGDLGVEVPIEELAYWQKIIIDWCRNTHKPVIVATEMLKSMTYSQTPSRAEATDVANAVFDGTDALMLSEETAIGKYPGQSVLQMRKILEFTEENAPIKKLNKGYVKTDEILIEAAARIVEDTVVDEFVGIIVFTKSGKSARMLSSFRPKCPIVAISDNPETFKSLTLSYGVIPIIKSFQGSRFAVEDRIFDEIKRMKICQSGRVVVIHGQDWLSSGTTSDISLLEL